MASLPASNAPHNILLVSGTYTPCQCGIGQFTARLATALREHGATVTVCATARPGLPPDVVPVPDWTRTTLRTIAALVRERNISVVNLQYPTTPYGRRWTVNFLPGYLRRTTGVPTVVTVHEFGTFSWRGRMRMWPMLRSAAALITPDEQNAQVLTAAFRSLPPIHVVPVGPNIEPNTLAPLQRAAARAKLGVPPGRTLFGFFGYLSPAKGLLEILQAMGRLKTEGSTPLLYLIAPLTLIEEVSPRVRPAREAYLAEVCDFIASHDLSENIIHAHDFSPEGIAAALPLVDVMVLPYADGATTRRSTLITSLTAGLPVITTEASPPLPLFRPLLRVPPRDPQALATAMRDVLTDEKKRAAAKAASLALAPHFSWDRIARETLRVFTDLHT